MLKRLQKLAQREPTGSLSGKQLSVGERVVKVDRLLGEGGFATIYHCTDVETGAAYALKHFLLTCAGFASGERMPTGGVASTAHVKLPVRQWLRCRLLPLT